MKTNSAFKKWFEKQHGKRPSDLPMYVLLSKMYTFQNQTKDLELLVAKTQDWDNRATSAFHAWQIKENSKTK